MKMAVVGHTTIDLIYVPSHPMHPTPGGSAVYASLTALRLGCHVIPVSKVGCDFPDEFVVWLSRSGLDMGFFRRARCSRTTSFKLVYKNGDRVLKLLNLCEPITSLELEKLPSVDLAHVGSVAGEVDLDVLEVLRAKTRLLSLDVQGFIRKFKEDGTVYETSSLNSRILSIADVVKLSMKEAEALTKRRGLGKVSRSLRRLCFGVTLLTVGDRGALCMVNGQTLHAPAYKPLKMVDSTGAGDSFAAGFIVEYLRSGEPSWSLAVASAASSFIPEGYGPSRFGSKEEVYERAEVIHGKIRKIRL